MRGLKNCFWWRRQTHTRISQLYDWNGPVRPIQWRSWVALLKNHSTCCKNGWVSLRLCTVVTTWSLLFFLVSVILQAVFQFLFIFVWRGMMLKINLFILGDNKWHFFFILFFPMLQKIGFSTRDGIQTSQEKDDSCMSQCFHFVKYDIVYALEFLVSKMKLNLPSCFKVYNGKMEQFKIPYILFALNFQISTKRMFFLNIPYVVWWKNFTINAEITP